jgi:hypothetical protein
LRPHGVPHEIVPVRVIGRAGRHIVLVDGPDDVGDAAPAARRASGCRRADRQRPRGRVALEVSCAIRVASARCGASITTGMKSVKFEDVRIWDLRIWSGSARRSTWTPLRALTGTR